MKTNNNNFRPRIEASESLRISGYAWEKLNWFRANADTEVTGFMVARSPDRPLDIVDVHLFKADVGLAHVHMYRGDEGGAHPGREDYGVAWMAERMAEGVIDQVQHMCIWWHTHPGNSAHPSATDEDTFDEHCRNGGLHGMFILAGGEECTFRMRYADHSRAGLVLDWTVGVVVDRAVPWPEKVTTPTEWKEQLRTLAIELRPIAWKPSRAWGKTPTESSPMGGVDVDVVETLEDLFPAAGDLFDPYDEGAFSRMSDEEWADSVATFYGWGERTEYIEGVLEAVEAYHYRATPEPELGGSKTAQAGFLQALDIFESWEEKGGDEC